MMTMELTLGPETQRMLEETLKDGYTADQIVRAGILAIDLAEQQIRQEKFHRWEDVRKEVRAMFERKEPPSADRPI